MNNMMSLRSTIYIKCSSCNLMRRDPGKVIEYIFGCASLDLFKQLNMLNEMWFP